MSGQPLLCLHVPHLGHWWVLSPGTAISYLYKFQVLWGVRANAPLNVAKMQHPNGPWVLVLYTIWLLKQSMCEPLAKMQAHALKLESSYWRTSEQSLLIRCGKSAEQSLPFCQLLQSCKASNQVNPNFALCISFCDFCAFRTPFVTITLSRSFPACTSIFKDFETSLWAVIDSMLRLVLQDWKVKTIDISAVEQTPDCRPR